MSAQDFGPVSDVPIPPPDSTDELFAISALGDPRRRALYEFVVTSGDWVSRDEAADAAGLERATAAHHLDRLAADGLLEVDYQRLSGRSGPGAGRPSKLYRRARREFEVSLPPRDYELAGRLLADAADRSRTEGIDIVEALDATATEAGERLAVIVRDRIEAVPDGEPDAQADAGPERLRTTILEVLEDHGFEPHVGSDGVVVLRNCPFHQLAQAHRDLICGMNLCMVGSALRTLDDAGMDARLEPRDGQCCVQIHTEH